MGKIIYPQEINLTSTHVSLEWASEWLLFNNQCSNFFMARTRIYIVGTLARASLFEWDDVNFVLDQHSESDLYTFSSARSHTLDHTHVAALWHIMIIPIAS